MFKDVKESDWSADHIARHDVTLTEIREAILERPTWNERGREDSTVIYGRTYAGRYLMIVAIDDHGEAFIITARDMTKREKQLFQRKAR